MCTIGINRRIEESPRDEDRHGLITILKPDHEEAAPDTVSKSLRRVPTDPVTVTVIENAKALLSYAAESLRDPLPVTDVVVHSKSAAGRPIDADDAEMLAARSHPVISGLSD